MKLPCAFCERPLDPTAPGAYREIGGWEEVRRQGGANKITHRQETGRVACASCISMVKIGFVPQGPGMFEEGT